MAQGHLGKASWSLAQLPKKHRFLGEHVADLESPSGENYCWWKKSCTSWLEVYPIIYKVFYIPGGAGFLPSTVCQECIENEVKRGFFG